MQLHLRVAYHATGLSTLEEMKYCAHSQHPLSMTTPTGSSSFSGTRHALPCVCGGGICAARGHLANLANALRSCTWPHPGRCQGRAKHMRPVPKILCALGMASEQAEQGCQ